MTAATTPPSGWRAGFRIGVGLARSPEGTRGDLALVDRIARYGAPRWFLNQFSCSLRPAACDETVDYLVELAVDASDLTTRAAYLAQAEAELTSSNIYIPFGAPLRWSLIRSNVTGFVPNQWAFHPLPPMAEITR
jgi:ABC-type transport system substrate-binding protein